jgi:hypothetical protein
VLTVDILLVVVVQVHINLIHQVVVELVEVVMRGQEHLQEQLEHTLLEVAAEEQVGLLVVRDILEATVVPES